MSGKVISSHAEQFLLETCEIASKLDRPELDRLVDELVELRKMDGRLFFLGVGGSAANCSHAVNDFRKLCGIEAYSPADNVSELTARVNDDGWSTVFTEWLKISKLDTGDAVFVFSVGGGDSVRNVSPNIVEALKYAKNIGAKVFGVVGRDGGYTKQVGDCVVVVPTVSQDRVTPHAEGFQAVIWHCLVSDPKLQVVSTKW